MAQEVCKDQLYKHYKGKHYLISGLAVSATTGSEGTVFVLYKRSDTTESDEHCWAREYQEFIEEVINPKYPQDGEPYMVPRFQYVGGIDYAKKGADKSVKHKTS